MIAIVQTNFRYRIIFFLFLLGFSSCSSSAVDERDEQEATLVSETSPVSTPTEILPATHTPAPTLSPTDHPPNPTNGPDPILDDESEARRTAVKQTFELCSPLASEEINQLWEIVSDPYNPPPPGREERHQGVDFSYYRRGERTSIEGEEIHAILPGTVAAKIIDRLPYGNMVIVETRGSMLPDAVRTELNIGAGESLYHLYAHMRDEPLVDLQDSVVCGQKLGFVGLSGYNVVNAHLHLETRIGSQGVQFESMVFYDTSATQDQMDNYRRWRTGGEFVHFDPMLLFQIFVDYDN